MLKYLISFISTVIYQNLITISIRTLESNQWYSLSVVLKQMMEDFNDFQHLSFL